MKKLDNILIAIGIAGVLADMYIKSLASKGSSVGPVAVPTWYKPLGSIEAMWPLPGDVWYYVIAAGVGLKYKDKIMGAL